MTMMRDKVQWNAEIHLSKLKCWLSGCLFVCAKYNLLKL